MYARDSPNRNPSDTVTLNSQHAAGPNLGVSFTLLSIHGARSTLPGCIYLQYMFVRLGRACIRDKNRKDAARISHVTRLGPPRKCKSYALRTIEHTNLIFTDFEEYIGT